MIDIKLLEANDNIHADDYCRPLKIQQESWSDEIHFTSTYGGSPINNMKWTKVSDVLGSCWFGKPVKDFNKDDSHPMEFVRGDIPKKHILTVDNPVN